MNDIDEIKYDDLNQEQKEIADILGFDSLIYLSKNFGGEQIYIPKFKLLLTSMRNNRIKKEFNGNNYALLSKKYDLTQRQIRTIIKGRK